MIRQSHNTLTHVERHGSSANLVVIIVGSDSKALKCRFRLMRGSSEIGRRCGLTLNRDSG